MQLEELSNISDNLAMMPDPALQKFAQLHRQDPYMVSLALSESNRRKKMRMAAQGQAGAMPQPKVADAVIAGMAQTQLPENQGIAQIPTPNMRTLADGGIAGYEDDEEGMATGGMGGMFNFAQQSEPVIRMSGGGHIPRYKEQGLVRLPNESFAEFRRRVFEAELQIERDRNAKEKELREAERLQLLASRGEGKMVPPSPFFDRTPSAILGKTSASPLAALTPTDSAAYDPTENLKKIAQTNARYTTPSEPKNAEEAAMLNRYPVTKPAADKAPPAAAPTAGGVADLLPGTARLDTSYKPVAAPTAADAKSKASELYNSKEQILSLEGKQAQARQDIFNQRDERLAQLNAFSKEQGPAFAGHEKMLQKEELQDATDKEKAGLTALFKGFLAIAAGESPYTATNIAKGTMVGMGDYGDALKEFKKAAKERNKAMADIENARRAEAKGDFKDQQMFTDRANERLAASDDRFTGLISQITGKEADVAASLFNNMTNNAEETSRMMFKESGLNKRFMAEQAGLNARALMPTGEARTAMMLGTGNTQAERLKSGMAVLQELSTDKSGAKTVEMLAKINSDRSKNGEPPISMADLVNSAREYSALMYPKVTNEAPTRAR